MKDDARKAFNLKSASKVDSKTLEYGSGAFLMVFLLFQALGLEAGHIIFFWLLLYHEGLEVPEYTRICDF